MLICDICGKASNPARQVHDMYITSDLRTYQKQTVKLDCCPQCAQTVMQSGIEASIAKHKAVTEQKLQSLWNINENPKNDIATQAPFYYVVDITTGHVHYCSTNVDNCMAVVLQHDKSNCRVMIAEAVSSATEVYQSSSKVRLSLSLISLN